MQPCNITYYATTSCDSLIEQLLAGMGADCQRLNISKLLTSTGSSLVMPYVISTYLE